MPDAAVDATVDAQGAAPDAAVIDAGQGDSGSSDEEDGGSSPFGITDPESAIFAELTVRCTLLVQCCTPAEFGSDVVTSVDTCVSNLFSSGYLLRDYAAGFAENVEADVAAGRTEFDLEAAVSCLERFAAMSCDEVRFWRHEFYRPFVYGHLCPEEFVGQLDDLTPCEEDHECRSGGCFAHGATADGLTCGTLPGEYEPCFGRCAQPESGMSCVGSGPGGEPGTCVPGALAGGQCNDRNCAQGLVCAPDGICREDTRCDGLP